MVKYIAKVEVSDVSFGTHTTLSNTVNIQSSLCRNNKPTGVEMKCGVYSSLVNLKTVKNMHIDFSALSFSKMIAEVRVQINHDYFFNHNFLTLKALGVWFFNTNTVDKFTLKSEYLPNMNVLDSLIPMSSCFNMTKKEMISTHKISFNAVAKALIYNGVGDRVVSTELNSIKSTMSAQAELFDNRVIKIPINGYIEANLIGEEQNDVYSCIEP